MVNAADKTKTDPLREFRDARQRERDLKWKRDHAPLRRLILGSLAALAVVIVAAAVAVVVAISTQTAAVQEQDYRQCMADAGVYETTSAEDMVTIANRCYSSVYDEETTP